MTYLWRCFMGLEPFFPYLPSNNLRKFETQWWLVIPIPKFLHEYNPYWIFVSVFFCELVFMIRVKDKPWSGSNGSLVQPAVCPKEEGREGRKEGNDFFLFQMQ